MNKVHDGWTIDPLATLVMIPCKESGSLTPALMSYVYERFPVNNIVYNTTKAGLLAMRNQAVRDFLHAKVFSTFEQFVWFDDDLKPDKRTDDMFRISADVVGCRFATRSETAWTMPDDVHCSAMRFSRKVAKAMKPPYYFDKHSEDGMARTACECQAFRDQAKELGFTIVRAGYADHGNQGRWCS